MRRTTTIATLAAICASLAITPPMASGAPGDATATLVANINPAARIGSSPGDLAKWEGAR